MNNLAVVTVTPFSGTNTPDKNGEMPVMLQCIAGRIPNRNVLSGTVAKRMGIEIDKTYLMQVRENGFDHVFGPDYQFIKVHELSTGADIADTIIKLPEAEVIMIQRPEDFAKEYERKSNAIEGQRTMRIKEGLYDPAVRTSVTHDAAKEVLQGTSAVHSAGEKNPLGKDPLED